MTGGGAALALATSADFCKPQRMRIPKQNYDASSASLNSISLGQPKRLRISLNGIEGAWSDPAKLMVV